MNSWPGTVIKLNPKKYQHSRNRNKRFLIIVEVDGQVGFLSEEGHISWWVTVEVLEFINNDSWLVAHI